MLSMLFFTIRLRFINKPLRVYSFQGSPVESAKYWVLWFCDSVIYFAQFFHQFRCKNLTGITSNLQITKLYNSIYYDFFFCFR